MRDARRNRTESGRQCDDLALQALRSIALPLDRHPWAVVRARAIHHAYPREAFLRATLWSAIGEQ